MDPNKVMNPVMKAALKAANHPWRPTSKMSFLLDFGGEALTDEVRTAMGRYNVGRRKYRITDLWAMHSDGLIERIDLEP